RHDAVPELDPTGVELALPEECLEQRGLPGAVRPDERDMLAAFEHERCPVEQQLVACAQHDPLRLEDVAAGAGGPEKLEAEGPAPLRHRLELLRGGAALLLEAADLRELRLRLLRLGLLVAEPRHESLEALDVVRDAVELRRRGRRARSLLATPGVPGAVE